MKYSSALLALSAAGAATASPLFAKRQASSSSAGASSVEATASGNATAASSAVASATSALSSVVASAASDTTSSAPAPTATSAANATSNSSLAFGCPDGYSVTYVIGTDSYPDVNASTAYNALVNWNVALPPPISLVNQTGSGPGAMRTWSALNLTVAESLVNQTDNATAGFIEQVWNASAPINVSQSLVISNATSDLTLYTNSTSNDTSVQLFVNFCVNDQAAGLALYSEIVTAYLEGLNSLFTNSTSGSNATSSVTSAVGGASSSAASGASSASSAATSAASAASSVATSVASDASSAASSVSSDIVSGGASGVSAASSVVASITSAAASAVTSA